jgi:hypothetical protein
VVDAIVELMSEAVKTPQRRSRGTVSVMRIRVKRESGGGLGTRVYIH